MAYGGIMGKGLPGNVLKSQVVSGGDPLYTQVNINLSTKNEGDIITLPEGGKNVEFYVAKKDYEPGLNTNRTLLVRRVGYDQRQWNNTNVNTYATSTLDTWLNGDYKAKLPEAIQMAIGTTKFYYTPGNGNNTVTTLERSIFTLSTTELVGPGYGSNTEGSQLPNSSLFYGIRQWTRSPVVGTTNNVQTITSNTAGSGGVPTATAYSRPVFTLPNDFTYTYYIDSAGNAYEDQVYSDASYQFVNQAGVVMPIAQIETGSYVGTGTYGQASPTSLIFSFMPKMVIIYLASKGLSVAGEGNNVGWDRSVIWTANQTNAYMGKSSTSYFLNFIQNDKQLSYYHPQAAGYQLNQSGLTYNYIAIG